jgi:MFS family permease
VPAESSAPAPAVTPHAATYHGMAGRIVQSFPALGSPDFRLFLFTSVILTVGSFMQQTAQGWLVLELTNSEALLGLAGAVAGFPTLFLAIFAGVLVDRMDRKKLLVAGNLAQAAFAFALAILASTGLVAYWHVLVLALLAGTALTIQMPTAQAVLSSIVDRTAIGNAVALNSAQYNMLRILAPAVAGLFIAAGSLAFGFWINAIAMAVAATLNARLSIPRDRSASIVRPAMLAELRDGIRYVAANRVLATIVVLPGVPALLVLNYITFFPIYARDILGVGAGGYGLLTGAIGVGAVVGALSIATFRPSGGSGRLVLGGLAIVGLALATFAVSRSLPLSMLALAILGTFQVSFYSTTNTLIQVLVPSRLRGRVLSLYLLTSIGLIPIGNLVAGAIAEQVGVEAVLAAGGLITVAIVSLVALAEPRVARLRAAHISASAAEA